MNHREILDDMEKALAPVIEKYKGQIAPERLLQLEEGLITSSEVLIEVCEPMLAIARSGN